MLKRIGFFTILLTISCIYFVPPLFAEIITLKSGRKVEGKIIEKTADRLKIDIAGTPITYYTNEIASIDGVSNPPYAPSSREEASNPKSAQDIFQSISPAVVYITKKTVNGEERLASGFIINSQGTIITNYHVVHSAKELHVRLKDNEIYPVTEIGYFSASHDICVLKINAHNLTSVTLGDSNTLKIGETLYCIGNPLGLEYSFSNGMLSGVRNFSGLKWLQFTAPISEGNSGGPLLNSQGQVVGIVTFGDQNINTINFALAINEVKPHLNNLTTPFSDFVKKVSQADFYFIEAFRYYLKNDLSQAITYMTKVIEMNTEHAEAYNSRGIFYENQGNFAQAISDYTKAIEINPNFAEAYGNRANAYNAQGNFSQALSDHNKSIELNPNDATAFYNRGNIFYDQGNLVQAISDYTKAIEINPNFAEAYGNRANAYNAQGNITQAITDLTKNIEINPNYANNYYNRAVDYYAVKEYNKAWQDVHKAEALGYKAKPEFLEALKKASGREE